ncbi:MAG: ABC transporter substrate-binding protein [Dehalococcoidia bacterium]|nr:ABC transporter substrate-binding protein [Dehalococcoidia bacterium]
MTVFVKCCTKAPAAAPAPTQAATAPSPTAPAAAKPTVAAAVTPAAQAKPTTMATVKFGSPGAVSDAGVYVGVDRGYFKDLGLDVQVLPFQSGPLMVAPLASGDLDVAGGSISTALLNAIDRGVALKMVAGKGSNIKGYDFSWVVVRKDLIDSGKVKDIKDIKGLKVAVGSVKSGVEAIVYYLMKQAGMNINDVELIAMGDPDKLTAFGTKGIDVGVMSEPAINTAVEQGLAVRWAPGATSSIYGGEYQAAELDYSEQFSKNSDAARRFMVGYVKGLRDYNDAVAKGLNKASMVSILAKFTAQKDPALYDKMLMPYLNPDGKIHMPSVGMDFDYFKQMGYYTGNLTLQGIVDTQITDHAVQQLGSYK